MHALALPLILSCRLQSQEARLKLKAADACASLPRAKAALAEATACLAASAQKAEGLREQLQRLRVSLGMLAGQGRPPPA